MRCNRYIPTSGSVDGIEEVGYEFGQCATKISQNRPGPSIVLKHNNIKRVNVSEDLIYSELLGETQRNPESLGSLTLIW